MFPDTSHNHFFFINLEGDLTIKQTLEESDVLEALTFMCYC